MSARKSPHWPTCRYAVLLLVVAGCAPAIKFDAAPRHICPGQPVTLSWSVVGSATMTATPPIPGFTDGPIPTSGTRIVEPQESTTVSVQATRLFGKPTASTQEIRVVAGQRPEPMTASLGDDDAAPGCNAGKVWATVHARRFTSDVTVETVREHIGDARTYNVQHDGITGEVRPGMDATQFKGKPIVGDWVVSSPLRPGETCGTASLPRSLVIDILTACKLEDER